MASQRLEERHDARGRVVAVEEDGAVVGQVERAVDDLHALAVHRAVVVARRHARVELRGLDPRPRLQQFLHDRLPVPPAVRRQQRVIGVDDEAAAAAASADAGSRRWRRRRWAIAAGVLAVASLHVAAARRQERVAAWACGGAGRARPALQLGQLRFVRLHLLAEQAVGVAEACDFVGGVGDDGRGPRRALPALESAREDVKDDERGDDEHDQGAHICVRAMERRGRRRRWQRRGRRVSSCTRLPL